MTAFQRSVQRAQDAFQDELREYGLTVSSSYGGGYTNDECTEFALRMSSKNTPVKGNMDLIKRLKKAGYFIYKHSSIRRPGDPVRYLFRVEKTVLIEVKEG